VINRSGIASQHLFAVGPLTRAALWEIVAIPDIGNQCAELAVRLATVCDPIAVTPLHEEASSPAGTVPVTTP
jgi:uncharacterized NAD(P)/FAD-binding protein YdhS